MIGISKKEKTEFNKLQKRLCRLTGQAIEEFNMIEEGDRVMVCLSGGADNFTYSVSFRGVDGSVLFFVDTNNPKIKNFISLSKSDEMVA